MEYTKQQHDAELRMVQQVLDRVRVVIETQNYQVNEPVALLGDLLDGRRVQISFTSPTVRLVPRAVGFINLLWGSSAFDAESLTVRFTRENWQVSDDARFSLNGTYQGIGQIYCWHEHHEKADVFLGEAQTAFAAENWQKIKYGDKRLLGHRR